MSNQLRFWWAKLKSLSISVTALKHVEKNHEAEGSDPVKTQPNGKRTVFGVFSLSVSNYSNGRLQWSNPWPTIFSTSPKLYFFGGIRCNCVNWTCNDSKSNSSVPTFKYFLTYGVTTKTGRKPPERIGVNVNSTVCVSMVSCESTPWSVSFKAVPCTFNFLGILWEINQLLHAESETTSTSWV